MLTRLGVMTPRRGLRTSQGKFFRSARVLSTVILDCETKIRLRDEETGAGAGPPSRPVDSRASGGIAQRPLIRRSGRAACPRLTAFTSTLQTQRRRELSNVQLSAPPLRTLR